MLPLTKELTKITSTYKSILHWGKRYSVQFAKDKNYWKVSHCRYFAGKCRGASNSKCNLRFHKPNEIPVAFRNGSNYDYNNKRPSKLIWEKIWMSWKSKKKYKRFSVLIRKEVDNKGNENIMINS